MHVLTTGELSHLILDIRLENAEKNLERKVILTLRWYNSGNSFENKGSSFLPLLLANRQLRG